MPDALFRLPGCRRPRTLNMGHDDPGLRWRWLHGLSPSQSERFASRSLITSPIRCEERPPSGGPFVCPALPLVTGLAVVQDGRLVDRGRAGSENENTVQICASKQPFRQNSRFFAELFLNF